MLAGAGLLHFPPLPVTGTFNDLSVAFHSERKTSDNVDHSTHEKSLGISVSMQTETSWIYEHIYRKTDIHAVLSQDLSSLGILCDMEFNEDFIRLFEESLRTLSHIGPPTILAYRPESSREDMEIQIEEESLATCEYCGSLLKLFPSYEELDPASEDYESFFCCEQNQDLYEYIITEKKIYENARNESISIHPHAAHGSEVDRQKAREKEYQRQQERQIAKQFAFMAAEQASFVENSKQLKTISYQLSHEPPSPGGWTLMPYETVERVEKEEINYSTTCCDFTIAGGKLMKRQFLEKYYKQGGKFLTIFPDGTAQLLGEQAKFNVGTKVQVRQPDKRPPPKHVCEEDLLLFACKIKIQRLFDRLHGCLNFPSTEQWDKIKPPSYLATQALKLMHLCKNSDVSDDADCSIRAIINAPV
ncbi:hypothetical protein UY3_04752 [Chelonia mydas]|uniref:FAM194 C-terminal domain-containing protein n=1 Tax=Chelonia mydas TaxID=8469 RepID=M7BL99_CHEMY|nr:hypothetical protein UY3_04752 [Chelonia mydas]